MHFKVNLNLELFTSKCFVVEKPFAKGFLHHAPPPPEILILVQSAAKSLLPRNGVLKGTTLGHCTTANRVRCNRWRHWRFVAPAKQQICPHQAAQAISHNTREIFPAGGTATLCLFSTLKYAIF